MREFKHPYLVQRMTRRDGHGSGVDSRWKFDYMGAAEFEYGALPASLKIMRSDPDRYPREPISIGFDPYAWAVCPREYVEGVRQFFNDELNETRRERLKEYTGIRETYYGKSSLKFDAWWAIPGEPQHGRPPSFLPWLIFRTRQHAIDWIEVCWP